MRSIINVISATLIIISLGCTSQFPSSTQIPSTEILVPPEIIFLPTITQIIPTQMPLATTIPGPPKDYFYHGVYPGGITGEEDDITLDDLVSYENSVGKSVSWVYFSNNWYNSREFPVGTAKWIRSAGSVPYIRLMLRSSLKHKGTDPVYSLHNIIDGQFDADLHTWCADAHDFRTPILVEYGTEVNSNSFAWSGVSNGAGELSGYGDPTQPDGPERFKDAYRHIIQICRDEDALNITWVFHLDSESTPDTAWNKMENYYPGNEWIDWIGISIYGAYTPQTVYINIFNKLIDNLYPRIIKIAPEKPIIIAELGTTKNNLILDQVNWTRNALTAITSLRYPNLAGFSWWNERWQNDGDPKHDTTMRVQDNPELIMLFQDLIGKNQNILGEIFR